MIDEWAEPPFTLHDENGEPFAARIPSGSYIKAAGDYTSALAWDEVTATKVRYEVVWHGGKRRNDWSRTKGELLGEYARQPDHFRWLGISGPVAKNNSRSWARFQAREEED